MDMIKWDAHTLAKISRLFVSAQVFNSVPQCIKYVLMVEIMRCFP